LSRCAFGEQIVHVVDAGGVELRFDRLVDPLDGRQVRLLHVWLFRRLHMQWERGEEKKKGEQFHCFASVRQSRVCKSIAPVSGACCRSFAFMLCQRC
jgi:hypothetical protein